MKIYLISSYLNGEILYKIGITKRNVEKRLKELKTGNPAELSIVEVFESKWGSKIETNLHQRYKILNISREWFCLTENDVKEFINNCQKIHDIFEHLEKTNLWFQTIKNK